jgi:hypothetical protein
MSNIIFSPLTSRILLAMRSSGISGLFSAKLLIVLIYGFKNSILKLEVAFCNFKFYSMGGTSLICFVSSPGCSFGIKWLVLTGAVLRW